MTNIELYKGNDNPVLYCWKETRKYKNYKPVEMQVSETALLVIAKDLGISDPPVREELKRLNLFIKRYFQDVSIQEVQLAFDLYTAGKLDYNKEHFGKFAKPLMAGVLNAFKRYRQDEINKQNYRNELMALPEHTMTKEEMIQQIREDHKRLADRLIIHVQETGSFPFGWNYGDVFLHLIYTKEIVITDEYKIQIEAAAIAQLVEEEEVEKKAWKQNGNAPSKFVDRSKDETTIKQMMRKLTVMDHLKQYLKPNE